MATHSLSIWRTARRAERAELKRRAVELRKRGATYQQIADELGYAHRGSAQRLVQEAVTDVGVGEADTVRALELLRLDVMWMFLWARLGRGDTTATEPLLAVMDIRARLTGVYVLPPQPVSADVPTAFAGFMAAAVSFASAPHDADWRRTVHCEGAPAHA